MEFAVGICGVSLGVYPCVARNLPLWKTLRPIVPPNVATLEVAPLEIWV
jgi:hypothetical protein